MSGRPSAGSNRVVTGSTESFSHHDRFYPIRSPTINPGISRNTSGTHHLAPGMLSGMTIRAVTPEAEDTEDGNDTDDSLAPQHSPTTPPRTPSRSGNRIGGDFEFPVGGSPEASEPSSPRRRRGQQSRTLPSSMSDLNLRNQSTAAPVERSQSVTPVAEGRLQETPPATMPTKKASISSVGHPSSVSSVGFPSATPTTSPAAGKATQGKPNKRFLRPQSSVNTLHKHASSDPPISPVQSTDVSRVLRLMKERRGRMKGILEFRVADNPHWTRGYCLINEDTGSLVHQGKEGISSSPVVVIPDLRGCQVMAPAMVDEADGIIEVLTHSSKLDIKLRPVTSSEYDYWLAALLCWQPIRPAGAQNKMVKPHQPVLGIEKKGTDRRRNSDASTPKDAAIIKVGRMLLWRKGGVHNMQGPSGSRSGHRGGQKSVTWERISCTLQENGEFRLFTEADTNLLTVIQLSQLNRCAVQILDPSILDQDFCIAIYPQYTPSTSAYSLARPVYLAVEPRTDARMIFEVWYVLLRAFTMPELYGPAVTSTNSSATSSTIKIPEHGAVDTHSDTSSPANPLCDSYRIQRSLFLRIIEAKITGFGKGGGKEANNDYELSSSIGSHHSHLSDYKEKKMDCYAEVVLDGEARAKTMVRTKTANPFWREDYEFPDLPAVLSDVAVILKQRDPRWKKNGGGTAGGPGSVAGSGGFGGGLGGTSIPGGRDTILGRVDIQLDELKMDNETEAWWPLMNLAKGTEDKIGEMFLKIGLEELIVLMADEYKGLSELLYNFKNGLTHQLALIMTSDLRRLAMTLLKIYQVAGKASEWLMALAEEEIDGPYKETAVQKLLSEASSAADSVDEQIRRETIARMDANILFRGNSLLTKALDAHMRRLGREYLDETLGAHLKKIADEDTYCEVDPIRVERPEDLSRNWRTLLGITKAIWRAIYSSHQKCPIELRRILKHIRTCVEDRYGDILKTVSYSSVSGFLFLRFFCPAVLNPKLFGLLKDHPGVRAQRTLTLIAKSLQGLANMTTFGVKEPWMEPMNEFLVEHTDEFKDFIDSISNFSNKNINPVVPPAYVTPTTILSRLSQSSREGFPSLPYLIDQPRAFASLVMMWDKWYPIYRDKNPNAPLGSLGGDLTKFHTTCLNIRERMRECVEKAENAERPNSSLSTRWEEVAEKVAGPVFSQHYHNQQMWAHGAPAPGEWNSGDSKTKYGSTKGHKILGVSTGGGAGSSILEYPLCTGELMGSSTTLITGGVGNSGGVAGGVGGDGVGMHYLSKKTLSELVGGLRKKVKNTNERERDRERDRGEREREREEKRERREAKERERAQNKGEWKFEPEFDEKPEKAERSRKF